MANSNPILGNMASAMATSRKSSQSSLHSIDRAVGAAASLGLSLALFRWVLLGYQNMKRLENEGDNDPPCGDLSEFQIDSIGSFFEYLQQFLRNLLLAEDTSSSDDNGAADGPVITHQGSCHCESVQFELKAPRCLVSHDGPGKIQYRHTKVKTSNFRVVKGKDCLRTYYVVSEESSSRGAHAFCGRCGVHILYAPCKDSPDVNINVSCVSGGIRKVRVASTRDNISGGFPIDNQWDDALSTISEVLGSPRLFRPIQKTDSSISGDSSEWKGYNAGQPLDLQTKEIQMQKNGGFDHPPTPTTIDSLTATDTGSQVSALKLPTTEQDSLATETESLGSSSVQAPSPSKPPRSVRTSSDHPRSTATPQLRDQMKYFMRKHLKSTGGKETVTNTTQ